MPVLAVTLRIRRLSLSAMNMLPDGSTVTSVGLFNDVLMAAILSSVDKLLPPPATVVIKPVLIVILRIRLLRVSAMKMLPVVSRLKPLGLHSIAEVARPLSPP